VLGHQAHITLGRGVPQNVLLLNFWKKGVPIPVIPISKLKYMVPSALTGRGMPTDLAINAGTHRGDPVTIPLKILTDPSKAFRISKKLLLNNTLEISFDPKWTLYSKGQFPTRFHANGITFTATLSNSK